MSTLEEVRKVIQRATVTEAEIVPTVEELYLKLQEHPDPSIRLVGSFIKSLGGRGGVVSYLLENLKKLEGEMR